MNAKKPIPYEKRLSVVCPDSLHQWDYERNELTPDDVRYGEQLRVHWICPDNSDHRWEALISSRSIKSTGLLHRCPFCSNRRVHQSNSLARLYPELLEEWDYELNPVDPQQVLPGSNERVHWICKKNPGHRWSARVNARTYKNQGCKHCYFTQGSLSENAELSSEWDYGRNDLSPEDVTCGSHYKAWWRCSKDANHSWQAMVCSRAAKGPSTGCPHCAGKRVVPISATHPHLVYEWDNTKNSITPDDVTEGSGRKVWWVCRNDPSHTWEAQVRHRATTGSGCPVCCESRGEVAVAKVLDDMGVIYKRQHRFPFCRSKRSLPFDFVIYLPNRTPKAGIIEYNGEQHYQAVDNWGGQKAFEDTRRRDAIKRKFARERGIPMLTIPHWHNDNLAAMVTRFLKLNGS